jgi:hypothetical protein
MSYKIETVSDRNSISRFLRLPHDIYRDDPNWVAPFQSEIRRIFDTRRNPYFSRARLKLFLCSKGKQDVARVAVVIHPAHWEKFAEKVAFFGFFESFRDEEAVRRLFETAEQYCMAQGARRLEGPFNPNHYSELGLQTDRFGESPVFFETYNPSYYPRLLEGAGYAPVYRVHTRKNAKVSDYVRERYGEIGPPKESTGYTVRHFNPNDLKADLECIREVYNDAFSENWHFLPLSREEYLFSAKFLRWIMRPDLITIVEHRGKPVGVLQCALDINPLLRSMRGRVGPMRALRFLFGKKRCRNLVIFAVGIRKAYQNTRVYKFILDSMCRTALKADCLSTTWMSEDNLPAIRASEHLGLVPYKQFAIYAKAL